MPWVTDTHTGQAFITWNDIYTKLKRMGIEINDKSENQQHWNLEQKEALISNCCWPFHWFLFKEANLSALWMMLGETFKSRHTDGRGPWSQPCKQLKFSFFWNWKRVRFILTFMFLRTCISPLSMWRICSVLFLSNYLLLPEVILTNTHKLFLIGLFRTKSRSINTTLM